MPRKARSYVRHQPLPDPLYGSAKYAKFINYLMERGKKSVAQRIFYDAVAVLEQKAPELKVEAGEPPRDGRAVFDAALRNITPLMELKSRRVGGANYQVPMEVVEPRRTSVAMKWLIAAARARKGMAMHKKLAAECLEAFNKQGSAYKKKEDTHRMAEANKAFAHFARFGKRKRS